HLIEAAELPSPVTCHYDARDGRVFRRREGKWPAARRLAADFRDRSRMTEDYSGLALVYVGHHFSHALPHPLSEMRVRLGIGNDFPAFLDIHTCDKRMAGRRVLVKAVLPVAQMDFPQIINHARL